MASAEPQYTAPPVEEMPWHAAFPAPQAKPAHLAAEELRDMLDGQSESGAGTKEFLVVDVRRTDFEVAFIRGAVNLPAHSFYQTLDSLLPILTGYRQVIFHCQSSSGRGPRCAGWYQDALNSRGIGAEVSKAVVLTGGIKRWVELYGDDEKVSVKL